MSFTPVLGFRSVSEIYVRFVATVCADGIEAATRDYTDAVKRQGAVDA